MKTSTSRLSDPDIQINHRLLSPEGKTSLTILDRYHLIGCYLVTALLGLIFNAAIPAMAACAKFCAEGYIQIDDLDVLGWSPDQSTCWFVAVALSLASMLKVFSLAREQFPGFIGFVTTLILCFGLEWQWIVFKPSLDFGFYYLFDCVVTTCAFSFVVAANAFSGASTLAIQQREKELRFKETMNETLATRAAVLDAQLGIRHQYDAALEEVLDKGTSPNGKMNLKIFRVVNGDDVEYWLGPNGDDLQIRLSNPNPSGALTAQPPKVSQDRSQSSPKRPAAGLKSTIPLIQESQNGADEDEEDPNNGPEEADETPIAAASTGAKNSKNRR
jgi:hypothetical protein